MKSSPEEIASIYKNLQKTHSFDDNINFILNVNN